MQRVVECVPNFSEGRRSEVIDAIAAAASVRNVYLLDRHMDADHNRSVLTLAGAPETIVEGVFAAVNKATELIDLRAQRGAHPRMGATDVIPFVPVRGVTMDDCVKLARDAGQRIADELHIPVYLYEAAATRPERVRLETIRLASPEERGLPDFGPAALHPTAGAVSIGARKFLIAFNINLETSDVRVAKEIAKRIRTSGGGLPGLKAMGVFLKGRNQAQVSMNVTDYEQTSLRLVFETVTKEAQQMGIRVAASELVGLVPTAALDPAFDLHIEYFSPSMVLENRLADIIPSV